MKESAIVQFCWLSLSQFLRNRGVIRQACMKAGLESSTRSLESGLPKGHSVIASGDSSFTKAAVRSRHRKQIHARQETCKERGSIASAQNSSQLAALCSPWQSN